MTSSELTLVAATGAVTAEATTAVLAAWSDDE